MFPFARNDLHEGAPHVSVRTSEVPSCYDNPGSLDLGGFVDPDNEPLPQLYTDDSLSLSWHNGDTPVASPEQTADSQRGGHEPHAEAVRHGSGSGAGGDPSHATASARNGAQSGTREADKTAELVESVSQAFGEALRDGLQQSLAPLTDCVKRLSEVSAQLAQVQEAQANGPRRGSSTVRIADMRLKEFAGHKNPNAQHIDSSFFLPLLQWLQDCKLRLATYDFAEADKVAALVSALTGGARAAFTALYTHEHVHAWSLDEAFAKLAALVPEHTVLFMSSALEMQFHRDRLIDDIKTFALYVQYGDQNAVGARYIWTQMQRKIASACPGLFAVAANEFNLHFSWNANVSFTEHVNHALQIVSTVQSAGRLADAADRAAGEVPQQNGRRGNKRAGQNGHEQAKETKRAKKDQVRSKPNRDPRGIERAKALGLCFNCGTQLDRKQFASHKAKCTEFKEGLFKANLAKAEQAKGTASGTEQPK